MPSKNLKKIMGVMLITAILSGCASVGNTDSNKVLNYAEESENTTSEMVLSSDQYRLVTDKVDIDVALPYMANGGRHYQNINRILQKPFKDEINRSLVGGDYWAVKDAESTPKKLKGSFDVLFEDDILLAIQPKFEDGYWQEPIALNKQTGREVDYRDFPKDEAFWDVIDQAFDAADIKIEQRADKHKLYESVYLTDSKVVFSLPPWNSGLDEVIKVELLLSDLQVEREALLDSTEAVTGISSEQKVVSEPYYTFAGEIPVVRIESNPEIGKSISDLLQRQIIMNEEFLQGEAKNNYERDVAVGYVYPPDIHNVLFDVKRNDEDILSVYTVFYSYTGGAHGNHYDVAYNFDMDTGNRLELKDVFKPEADYVSILNRHINKQIKEIQESYKSRNEDTNWVPYQGFSSIDPNQHFYMTEHSLVVFFDLYSIASYAEGIPSFEIPIEDLEDYLKF